MSIDVRATIWYCRWFSALSVLGLNEVMAWRASASVFFSLTAFLARLAASSEKEAQSMKRDWRAALSCMDCFALAISATTRLWSLRSCAGLSTLALLIQPSAMPPHIVGNVQLTSFFNIFATVKGFKMISKWFKMISNWIEMVSKLDGKNVYKMYIITHPIAKHWLKHNALKCPEPLKQISNKIITKSNKNKVEQHYDYNMIILWFDNIMIYYEYILNILKMLWNVIEHIWKYI